MRRLKQSALLIALTENKDRDVLFRENNPTKKIFFLRQRQLILKKKERNKMKK